MLTTSVEEPLSCKHVREQFSTATWLEWHLITQLTSTKIPCLLIRAEKQQDVGSLAQVDTRNSSRLFHLLMHSCLIMAGYSNF